MENSKIKIAFEPIGTWHIESFRNLIKDSYKESDCYEISIISNSFDYDYLSTIKSEIGEDVTISMYTNMDSLIEVLDTKAIDIYLNPTESVRLFVEAMAVTAVGVLVNEIMDTYLAQPKYITKLKFWIKYLKEGESLGKSCE